MPTISRITPHLGAEVHGADVAQPMVRTDPIIGRPRPFLGRRRQACIAGSPLAASEALPDDLWAHASRPDFSWRHGDLLLWDNRRVMHRRNPFDPAARRIMHRTQIIGDTPNFYPAPMEDAAVYA